MFELLNRMVYNRLATATMRNQMTQAETYISTPNSSNDYTYTYDAVGNVVAVYNANSTGRGNELYYFTQDAFGNELTTSPFSGTVWSTACTAGITEHQTGKWIDPFTGLYFFHARWYDSTVGRFVGREQNGFLQSAVQCSGCNFNARLIPNKYSHKKTNAYSFVWESPTNLVDVNGYEPQKPDPRCLDPKKKHDPTTTHYGNFCGEGTDLSWQCIPVDLLDACCRDHDNCWGYCEKEYKGFWKRSARKQCKKQCDRDLCHCTAAQVSPGGYLDPSGKNFGEHEKSVLNYAQRINRYFECEECWNEKSLRNYPPWWDDDIPFPTTW